MPIYRPNVVIFNYQVDVLGSDSDEHVVANSRISRPMMRIGLKYYVWKISSSIFPAKWRKIASQGTAVSLVVDGVTVLELSWCNTMGTQSVSVQWKQCLTQMTGAIVLEY